MIAGLSPYAEMKESRVARLGTVPNHWQVRRLRTVVEMRVSNVDKHANKGELPVRLCNYVDVYKNDHIHPAMPFMKATATRDEVTRFRVSKGDVIITKDSESWDDIGIPALVVASADDLVCGYHLALLRPTAGLLTGAYLFRVMQSTGVAYQLHVNANGVTRYGLSHAGIKSIRLPIPPADEQAAIVHFLDHADARIRRYIRAKQRLIELLEEQKQAIIHRAVTRGLDPAVRLKPSGVEWLGDVPEHWEVTRLGCLIEFLAGFPFKSEGFTQDETGVRLLRGVNIAPGRLRWADVVRWPRSDRGSYSAFELLPGDIVFGMDRPIIRGGTRVARVSESDCPALLLQRVARIRPKGELCAEFLTSLLAGKSFADYLRPIFTGISVPHLSPEQIKAFRVALPPIDEQREVVLRATEETRRASIAVSYAEREIELLREYRTRLVADVVTGKLDVREAAAALPDDPNVVEEADEPALDELLEEVEA